jgi:hypothetical protein
MRFRIWLEAVLSKQGIEFSTPENIQLLSQLPKRKWITTIALKYGKYLADFINGHVNDIPPEFQMMKLVEQLKQAGIQIHDVSKETMTGEFLSLAKDPSIMAKRLVNKWISASLGIPKNVLGKEGLPVDPKWRAYYDERIKIITANDLKPNIGVLWQPNAVQPSLNKFDDHKQEDEILWDMASQFKLGSSKEMKDFIYQRALNMFDRAAERNQVNPDYTPELAKELYDYVINNLMRFDRTHPNYLPAKKLMQFMDVKKLGMLRRATISNPHSISNRRNAYNQQQVNTNFANSTQDVHRTVDDPMTMTNRYNSVIPLDYSRRNNQNDDFDHDDNWLNMPQRNQQRKAV